ncbi:MAG: hydrogenase expression/formation protein HypE [Acidobacteria bacterium]|nr:hydrogenase expression/formation protein HypE [Acidobacteriota bacterium]
MNRFSCPAPLPQRETVVMGHGSGGVLSAELLREVILPAFSNPLLDRMEDQAIFESPGRRLAFTTDSFVVKPLFFPGGDIGSLAVHGTVNDLAMGGAEPRYLSVSLILEEGLAISDLRRIVRSMGAAARACGAAIVTGDTKVVERGSGDGVFINTAGIGVARDGARMSASAARPGDAVIVSGPLGDHGVAILTQREGLELESAVESDSAPLHTLVRDMLDVTTEIHCLRDPTRGGLASTLNEIAGQSGVGIVLEEGSIRVRDGVRGACELLGLDPLYVANEGKLAAVVPAELADRVVEAMRAHPLGREAAVVGAVVDRDRGRVLMRTAYGTTRVVGMLAGDQLPRIC